MATAPPENLLHEVPFLSRLVERLLAEQAEGLGWPVPRDGQSPFDAIFMVGDNPAGRSLSCRLQASTEAASRSTEGSRFADYNAMTRMPVDVRGARKAALDGLHPWRSVLVRTGVFQVCSDKARHGLLSRKALGTRKRTKQRPLARQRRVRPFASKQAASCLPGRQELGGQTAASTRLISL